MINFFNFKLFLNFGNTTHLVFNKGTQSKKQNFSTFMFTFKFDR